MIYKFVVGNDKGELLNKYHAFKVLYGSTTVKLDVGKKKVKIAGIGSRTVMPSGKSDWLWIDIKKGMVFTFRSAK